MASYRVVSNTDPNWQIMDQMDHSRKQYVLTVQSGSSPNRYIYQTYKSARQGFKAWRKVNVGLLAAPLLFLMNNEDNLMYYVNETGRPLKS